MKEIFRKFSNAVAQAVGSIWAFLIFIFIVALTGYIFDYSERWETNIGFLISLVTLSVLFFLQKSQNHSDKATHLKLDELIKAIEGARNEVLSVEDRTDEHLQMLKGEHLDLITESQIED